MISSVTGLSTLTTDIARPPAVRARTAWAMLMPFLPISVPMSPMTPGLSLFIMHEHVALGDGLHREVVHLDDAWLFAAVEGARHGESFPPALTRIVIRFVYSVAPRRSRP